MKEDKYKLFTQYMHNELGITKEDIRDWIREAVKEQADQLIDQTHGSFHVREILVESATRIVKDRDDWFSPNRDHYNSVKGDVAREVAKQVLESYKKA